jgi:LmbE family N-acetylglucosaminyl deacetylase
MIGLGITNPASGTADPLRVMLLGAHADDIEIGCGGFVLDLLRHPRPVEVDWCVLSATSQRAAEARASAAAFLEGAAAATITVERFEDGYFPWQGREIKGWFENLKARPRPDLVLTHARHDRHQDHREVCNLTWNTFRDHLIVEYEIVKYDGDLTTPNLYVPLAEELLERKIEILLEAFASQREKPWFDAESFRGLARLRGIECASPTRFAEAFHARKLVLTP